MIEKIKTYLGETRAEMKKVTWPTTAELKESTRVVLVGVVILTGFTGFVDWILSNIIKFVFR